MKWFAIFTVVVFICILASADTFYVSTNSPSDGPGIAWNNAFHTIQGGIDAASSNDVVLVTNGVYNTGARITPGYACLNRVVITKDITVRSVNGADVTIIEGAEATGGGSGSNAIRGVYITTGFLEGFTVTNGNTMTSGYHPRDKCGGGVNMYRGNGQIANCILTDNSTEEYGGGSYGGTLNNCILTGNNAQNGGGNSGSTLNNCTLSGNAASNDGGGSYAGILNNCTLSGNTSANSGGGSYVGTLNNCILSGNTSGFLGGGDYGGRLNNCTLSGNSANYGGGSFFGVMNNCIIYFNTAGSSDDNYTGGAISYSCTTPLPSGTGNITNDPQFVDRAVSNFHLKVNSPCIDSGNNTNVFGDTDLDGLPRIQNGLVDMGAYEYLVLGVSTVPVTGDFDGNGKNDFGCYDATGIPGVVAPGQWYLMKNAEGYDASVKFGYAGTVPVVGDFDGDGIDDVGCYDAAGIPGLVAPGQWYFMTSSNGFFVSAFGYDGTVPVVGDFDGDGIDDYGCYDATGIPGVVAPGQWYFMTSSNGFFVSAFGYDETVPVVGDFDGDGIDDYGCYDAAGIPGVVAPGQWYFMTSSNGFFVSAFGYAGTVPVVGDFDGDGIDDYGCYDAAGIPGVVAPGQWYFMKSTDEFDASVSFGYAGTVPVTGDFDGDGIDDFGCYDAAGNYGQPQGTWYFMKSTDGFSTAVFAYAGTIPHD